MAENTKKIHRRVPDEIRYQPVEWLVEYPGYKMKNNDKIMEKLKRLGCITIEDYIAHKTEFTDAERVEIKRKIFFNM